MPSVSSSTTINKPVETVFNIVIQPETMKGMAPGILEVKVTPPGPVALGSMYHVTSEYAGKKYESATQVSAFEPNKKWAYKTTGTPRPIEQVYVFEAAGAGTKLTISTELVPGSYPAAAEPMQIAQWQKTLAATCATIKAFVEK